MPQKEVQPETAQSPKQRSVCIPIALVRTMFSALRNHQKPLSPSPSRLYERSISRRLHSELRLPNALRLTETPMLLIPFAQVTALSFCHLPPLRLLPVLCLRAKGKGEV